MNIQHNGGSRSFAKEMRPLKMRSAVAGGWKLTTTSWEHHQSWSSYSYVRSCQRTQRGLFYGFLAFETNWKGEKALQVGASWPNHKSKKLSFWSVFSYSIQQQRTVSLSDCDMWRKVDFIRQLAMTNSVIRSIRISKALPKAKLAPKKGCGQWRSAAGLIHYSFESQWNPYVWANQWDA